MNYEPKKRWLNFINLNAVYPNRKTNTFEIHNKENGSNLGEIKWDTGWRCYVFDDGEIKLAEGCLYELFEKMLSLRLERENQETKP